MGHVLNRVAYAAALIGTARAEAAAEAAGGNAASNAGGDAGGEAAGEAAGEAVSPNEVSVVCVVGLAHANSVVELCAQSGNPVRARSG